MAYFVKDLSCFSQHFQRYRVASVLLYKFGIDLWNDSFDSVFVWPHMNLPGRHQPIVAVSQCSVELICRRTLRFPSGASQFGLRPSRYVAYYEMAEEGNENPRQIAYVARNVTFWNRISIGDARRIEDLTQLFNDQEVARQMPLWGETFHIALTEPPVRLSRPIPLGDPKYARVLSRRNYSFAKFLNARTIDDLF